MTAIYSLAHTCKIVIQEPGVTEPGTATGHLFGGSNMAIGKYVTNIGVITTVLGGFGVAKQTKDMPQDWRRYLVWVVWGASVALAIGAVSNADQDSDHIAKNKAEQDEYKRAQEALKKAEKDGRKQLY